MTLWWQLPRNSIEPQLKYLLIGNYKFQVKNSFKYYQRINYILRVNTRLLHFMAKESLKC